MDLVIAILGFGDWPQLVVALAPGLRVHVFRQPPAEIVMRSCLVHVWLCSVLRETVKHFINWHLVQTKLKRNTNMCLT